MRHNAVTLKEVTKAFGGAWLRRTNGNGRKLAVDRVSFDVKPGGSATSSAPMDRAG